MINIIDDLFPFFSSILEYIVTAYNMLGYVLLGLPTEVVALGAFSIALAVFLTILGRKEN